MAWFRCGGSGIPASLKSGMNSVLNKKFGTSTTYDPAGWPADVNLLGPLPVKSASGSIASFSDGADGVPVKSCSVSFVASGGGGTPSAPVAITGVSGLSVTRTNANLFALPSIDFTYKNVRYYTVNGVLYLDGSSTGETSPAVNEFKVICFTLPAGTYYLNRGSLALPTYIYKKSDGTQLRVNNGSFTLTETTECNLGFYIYNKTFSNDKADIMLNIGSSGITYVDAVTPSVVTDTFGQTLYGGERDLTTDKASVTYALLELAVADMNNSDNYPGWRDCGIKALGLETQFYNEKTNVGQGYSVNTTGSNDILFLPKNSYNNMTQTDWQTNYPNLVIQIVVPLATPTEITGLTPHEIDTLYGDNNIYADTGNTEVEYRADIDLALNA